MSVTPGVQIKCKICGEGEFHKIGNREVCRYCNAAYVAYAPGLEAELRMAESFRESAQFDVAATLYQKLLRTYEGQELSDVYWGLFLCEQKVMFETDEHGERFPSFYAITPAAPKESAALQNAIEAARCYDSEKAETYRALAEKITGAKELYRRIHAASKPYDIFICFKRSAADGAVTKDTDLAIDLYNNFAKNYPIFFSERSLRDVAVRDFEPNIYHALYTAKVMLLLCSKREYLESRWVKNEWSRYHTFAQNPAAGKTVIPIFLENFTPDQLPRELTSYQGLRDDRHLFDELGKTLQKILKPVDIEAELNKKLQAVMAQQAEEQRRMQEQQAEERRRMQEQLEKLASRPVTTAAHGNADVETMLQRMRVFLEEKDWQNATHCADRALETDPGNGDAYLGKLLANCKVSVMADLRQCTTPFDTDASYKYLLHFGSANTVETLKEYLAEVKERQRKAAEEAAERERQRKEAERRAREEAERERQRREAERLKKEKERREKEEIERRERAEAAEHERQRIAEEKRKRAEKRKKFLRIALSVFCVMLLLSVGIVSAYTIIQYEWQDGIRYARTADGFELENASGLKSSSVVIPSDFHGVPVTSIGYHAFSGCSDLTEITIPDSVTSIDHRAFSDCSGLTTITIPDSVTSIGKWAFYDCSSLTTVEFGANSQLTSIGGYAFAGCSGLTTITIPDSVTSVGEVAFSGCSSLTTITIPDSVTSIGYHAFSGCSDLTTITIPDSVTSIGEWAFFNCSGLTTITIPDSVTSIGNDAFYYCGSLAAVTFENRDGWWRASSPTATSGTSIASSELADSATAATYLKSTYCDYYWRRK